MNDDKHIDFATLKYYDQRNKQYIDTKIDGLKTEFNDVERRVDSLEATSRGHDEQLIAHREELDDLEARVINLERDDVSIRQDIADLRVAVENSGGGTGGVTKDYVDNAIEDAIESLQIPDVSDFVTKDDLAAEDFVTAPELTELTNTVASNQETIEDLQKNKANKSDLTGLATEEFVITKIAEAELNDKDVDLSQYYTKTEVDAKIPDVSNFATKQELEGAIAGIPKPDLSEYAKKTDIPSIEGLATEKFVTDKIAEIVIPEVPTKISELENDASYITANDIPDTSVFVTNETFNSTVNTIEENITNVEQKYTTLEETVQNISNTYVTNDTLVNNYTTTEDLEANYVSNITLEEKNYITTAEATTQIEQIVEQKVTEAVTPDAINYGDFEADINS